MHTTMTPHAPLSSIFAACMAGLAAVCSLSAGAAPPAADGPTPQRAAQGSPLPTRPLSLPTSGRTWPSPRFVYRADGKRVTEVLQDFAASQGLPAVIADGIDGSVQASFDSRPEDFLNAMSKAYGILWYHDSTALYFYPAKAIQSRLFRLKGFSRTQLEEFLGSLQVGDRRYPLRFNDAESTLLAYGPPRHIDLISSALESLDVGAMEKNRIVVRVFPLRFATAGDRALGDLVVPGLVTTLRGLFGGMSSTPREAQTASKSPSQALAGKLKSMHSMYGTDRLVPELERKAPEAAKQSSDRSSMGGTARGLRSPVDDEDDAPILEADENTNAIVVYGRVRKMADISDVIRRLDTKPTMIELEAMIIDVSSDSVDRLGIDWTVRGSHGSVGVASPNNNLPDNSRGGGSPGSFTISTLWANAGRELMARIDVLQAEGKAKVIAKPRVLGVANRPAMMQEKRVAAVRVSGNLEANLYQVEAGTLLQVTPQVVSYEGASRIKLSLYIEDGNFESNFVDNVPIVKRTQIRTEAHVAEGESLLIGGITLDSDSTHVSGVPGLMKLPLVGGLFRWQGKRSTHNERLFLITPKRVKDIALLPAANPPAPAPSAPVPAPAPAPAAPRAGGYHPFDEFR